MSTEAKIEKTLRGLPGLMAWVMLVSVGFLSIKLPEVVAYLLLVYALYWVFRTLDHIFHLVLCFFHLQKDVRTDWLKRCERLQADAPGRVEALKKRIELWWETLGIRGRDGILHKQINKFVRLPYVFAKRQDGFKAFIKDREELKFLEAYVADASGPNFNDIQHLVIIPTYKEGMKVLTPSLEAITSVNFPLDRVHIVLATEAADPEAEQTAEKVKKFCRNKIPNLYISKHTLLPGETAGKSANQAYTVRWFQKEIMEKRGIPKQHLLVTSLDADYRMHPEYFGNLSYKYLVDPRRAVHMYQPIPMFFNNIWRVNMFSRVEAALGTQIQMARQMKVKENRSWSSYAACFSALEKAGFWDEKVIQEDSRMYWRLFFTFGEEVRYVTPLFLPVYGDAVQSKTYFRSLKSLYQQLRRWAWGASDVAYVLVNCYKHKEIHWRHRLRAAVNSIAEYFNWATLPIILGLGSIFPLYFSPDFSQTVMAYNLPLFTSRLLTFTSVAAVALLTVDAILSPPKPKEWNSFKKLITYTQWLTIPVIGIIFGALPALDAQTRLLIGKNLEYQVTEKGS